jgi:nicotinamidase-related amidase
MRINKFRFGTFVDGSSDLHPRLRARGIDTVIITGCATNIWCKSTARDVRRAFVSLQPKSLHILRYGIPPTGH